ncbi:unnamed protein product [Sphenostylis stenocarpa]|uniref:Uncharacterized protein n=1 Tax=Sphenostylis stenocarpa TaxID=92480 RepID=A0AA86VVX6_9FABA|nr:unnamed protein product [Sphenostylis stenocarpa]
MLTLQRRFPSVVVFYDHLVSQFPIPGSLTCLEGSSESAEWRMDGIPDLIKVQREENSGLFGSRLPAVRTVDKGDDLVIVQQWTVRMFLIDMSENPVGVNGIAI